MERKAKILRKTKETEIELELNIDGNGISSIESPLPFLNHVLESFSKHGNFDLSLKASGDIKVDSHHLVEDIGICLGKAITDCLKNKEGIERFSNIILPMDDAEVIISIDISGRPYLRYNVDLVSEEINGVKTSVIKDFFMALVSNGFLNLHITKNSGRDSHHIIEAIFKAFGRTLYYATRLSGKKNIPSTKGLL